MSLRVDPTAIGEHLAGRDFAYVLTGRGGRVHAVAHRVVVDGDRISVATASESLLGRIGLDPAVTLLWPPGRDVDGSDEHAVYSLIADGEAFSVDGVLTVVVSAAILHRPAP